MVSQCVKDVWKVSNVDLRLHVLCLDRVLVSEGCLRYVCMCKGAVWMVFTIYLDEVMVSGW